MWLNNLTKFKGFIGSAARGIQWISTTKPRRIVASGLIIGATVWFVHENPHRVPYSLTHNRSWEKFALKNSTNLRKYSVYHKFSQDVCDRHFAEFKNSTEIPPDNLTEDMIYHNIRSYLMEELTDIPSYIKSDIKFWLKVHELDASRGTEYIKKQMPESLKPVFIRKIIKKRHRELTSKVDTLINRIGIYGMDFIMPVLKTRDRILVIEKISADHSTQSLYLMSHLWIQYMKDLLQEKYKLNHTFQIYSPGNRPYSRTELNKIHTYHKNLVELITTFNKVASGEEKQCWENLVLKTLIAYPQTINQQIRSEFVLLPATIQEKVLTTYVTPQKISLDDFVFTGTQFNSLMANHLPDLIKRITTETENELQFTTGLNTTKYSFDHYCFFDCVGGFEFGYRNSDIYVWKYPVTIPPTALVKIIGLGNYLASELVLGPKTKNDPPPMCTPSKVVAHGSTSTYF